ncbi:ABC transporter ATP-binding protein [Lolliginicoccus suaedae]|uniref:ABC transporter ATP-binding protein n=1 Tax=Lolliginicoccus suaedae TaxID=2605429 RepID=UPI0011EC51FC|nr:ABC transporter ATP-binding protein [Lolliginicoccus suaedae]
MIRFERVGKRYPDGTTAVESLDLEVPAGTLTVLVGPSGCGKTTSLRMINRMVEPSGGRVLVDGVDVATRRAHDLRRGIGYVIQNAGLFPHRTVLDNVATVPRLLGARRSVARTRARELLELVGLTAGQGDRYPAQLSGGQQQRVGVARALAADPPILLMDEPFSAVDPVVRADLQRELLRLQGELRKTIVLVTHDIDEAITLGDRVAVLRPGGVLAQYAAPAELLARPADRFVEQFLGVDRGVRLLSFHPGASLPLRRDTVIGEQDAATAPWCLVVDADDRPLGWRRGGADSLLPIGHGFDPATDTLRAALDSAMLSPAGHAVGLDGDGRVLGTASAEAIAEHVRAVHAAGQVAAR